MGTDQGVGLPAELRGEAPTVEQTVEVDNGMHVPPEAAVTAVTHAEDADAGTAGDRPAPPTAADDSRSEASYRALAEAEAAAGRAHLPPAELRGEVPTVEQTVDVDTGMHVPPEAAITPVTDHEG
jgi:hypothetical protein